MNASIFAKIAQLEDERSRLYVRFSEIEKELLPLTAAAQTYNLMATDQNLQTAIMDILERCGVDAATIANVFKDPIT